MQPKSPSPEYDFILKDSPKTKQPLFAGSNKLLLVGVTAVVLFIIILIVGSLVSKKGGSSTGLIDAAARSQEIIRVTKEEQPNLKDPATKSLAATVNATLTSEQAQISKYLGSSAKANEKKLGVYKSPATDSQLAAAQQANNLDAAYVNYLRTALSSYSQSIKNAFSASKSTGAKSVLQNSFNSTQVLLSTPPLKNQ